MTHLPPCCADADEPPCAQHAQAARVDQQRLRLRGRGVTAVVGESGKAKPAPPQREEDR